MLARVVTEVTEPAPAWPGLVEASASPRWFAWHSAEVTIAACGEVPGASARDPERWRQVLTDIRDLVRGDSDALPVAVGGCSFNRRPGRGPWTGWPSHELVVPEQIWVRRRGQVFVIQQRWITPSGQDPPGRSRSRDLARAHERTRRSSASPGDPLDLVPRDLSLDWHDVESPADWRAVLDLALAEIESGTMAKVVVSRRRRTLTAGARVHAAASLMALRERYPNARVFAVGRPQGGVFLGATPETLLRVERGRVEAEALAGTLSADGGRSVALEQSDKDLREHRWVARAVEEAMQKRCRRLQRSGPQAVRFRDLYHLRTRVEGELVDPDGMLALVDELHPTPAVGGWPREPALAFLDRFETFDRGWFAAPVGWLAPDGSGHFAVALRSALAVGEVAYAFAGAGIVPGSVASAEWDETATKLKPATTCLRWLTRDARVATVAP